MKPCSLSMFCLVALSSCAVNEDDPVPTEAPVAPSTAAPPLSEFVVATGDGVYRFQFFVDDNGAVATVVESPLGAPRPAIDGDCALDTFLRVAPAGTQAPAALIAACPASLRHARQAGALPPPTELRFAPSPSAAALCAKLPLETRANELKTLGAYQPTISPSHDECVVGYEWDLEHCVSFSYGTWNVCDAAFWAGLLATGDVAGGECFEWQTIQDPPYLDPVCKHGAFGIADYSSANWRRFGDFTKVRAEISNCFDVPLPGSWKTKDPEKGKWSADQPFTAPPHVVTTVTLYAGASNGKYHRWGMDLTVSGTTNVASGWVDLGGLPVLECPIHL